MALWLCDSVYYHPYKQLFLSHNMLPHYILRESRFSVCLFVVVARLTLPEGKTTAFKRTSAPDSHIQTFNFPLLQDNDVKRQLIKALCIRT